jgi:hypothetical protein
MEVPAAQSHGTMLAEKIEFLSFIASGSRASELAGLPKAERRFGNSVFYL